MKSNKSNIPPIKILLDYELIGSWWVCYISWGWVQKIIAKYFAWKTARKYSRCKEFLEMQEKINSL